MYLWLAKDLAMKTHVLLLGSGGREHALAWKMAQSPLCGNLYIAPGNAGTDQLGTNVPLNPQDIDALYAFIQEKEISLVVVGPEDPLVAGVVDALQAKGVAVLGPQQQAAALEGSKAFSKTFMQKYGIPTASYATFQAHELEAALAYLDSQAFPIVVKASGLAAGKGVLICETREHAARVVQEMLSGQAFGAAGENVVIESFLKGIELSVFVITDGKDYAILGSAKDYKRIGEGDTGLNTGGMGAVSPVPFADKALMDKIECEIIQATLKGLAEEGIPYKGFIFLGIMLVGTQPYLLEYNVRMGDPETQVIMPRLKTDAIRLFTAVTQGELASCPIELAEQTCTTVVVVSGGYPEAYEKGKVITGLALSEEIIPFYAGVKKAGKEVQTSGGRVMAFSAIGANISEAIQKSLAAAAQVQFDGKYFRTDIGQDLL